MVKSAKEDGVRFRASFQQPEVLWDFNYLLVIGLKKIFSPCDFHHEFLKKHIFVRILDLHLELKFPEDYGSVVIVNLRRWRKSCDFGECFSLC